MNLILELCMSNHNTSKRLVLKENSKILNSNNAIQMNKYISIWLIVSRIYKIPFVLKMLRNMSSKATDQVCNFFSGDVNKVYFKKAKNVLTKQNWTSILKILLFNQQFFTITSITEIQKTLFRPFISQNIFSVQMLINTM